MVIEDCDIDSDEDEAPIETTILSVVFEQVYEETKMFEKVLKEKGPHYLESNSVVYPSFKGTDEVVFPN